MCEKIIVYNSRVSASFALIQNHSTILIDREKIMPITRKLLRDESDIPRIFDLAQSMPLTCRHIIDLPWRLSALDLHNGRDAAFWEDSYGKMVGFAACQYPWAVLDFFILPGLEAAVATGLFNWANERFQEKEWPYPYWIEFRDDSQERRNLAQAHGFLHEDEDRYVWFEHSLENLPPVPTLPEGFTLRTLRGEQEVAAYSELHRAAFESTNMNPEWRARTLHMPTYRSDLDLVISAPDGSLVGFCVGWFEPSRCMAQVEPIGVHPRFHQHSLGRILLLEILRRFKEIGATTAFVETYIDGIPARKAYEAVGFQMTHTIRSRRRGVSN
jgi:mycothiol synthase